MTLEATILLLVAAVLLTDKTRLWLAPGARILYVRIGVLVISPLLPVKLT